MEHGEAKHMVRYYKSIPAAIHSLERERSELEREYSGLRGEAFETAPHGGARGSPTEQLAIEAASRRTGERLDEIANRIYLLEADSAFIRVCLDALHGKYKNVIYLRYVRECSWAAISVRMHAPESTVRHWHDRALERLAEIAEASPEVADVLQRAKRARP
ncbi:MAG: hypothetical protein LIO57_04115 [Oscillospiraceae bacterium]|nr:hypothetical protein [Oscillospiraceae bacterium]